MNNLLEVHRTKVYEQLNNVATHITQGKCSSYDEYKKQCGIMLGLNTSLSLMAEAIKEINKDDDIDD